MNINRLQPIRKQNIPNANDIFPDLLQRDAWVKGYGVPFDGGLYLPVYAPKATGFKLSSWKDKMKLELDGKLTLDQAFYYGLYAAAYISDMEPGAKELYSKEGLEDPHRGVVKIKGENVTAKRPEAREFVTYDQTEALAMADRIVVMNEGRIVQIGSPHDIYYQPNSKLTPIWITIIVSFNAGDFKM